MDIKNKKLLLLGGINLACEIVETAKEMGVYTIVTDYLPDSPAKKYADEAMELSTVDTEAIAAYCIENNVDGVFTNFIDSMLPYCQKACEKLNKPFYLTAQQIDEYGIKDRFKQLCIENNVGTPCRYEISDEPTDEELSKIKYPVIVKPVDSSGSKGITVCYDNDNLRYAIERALSYSRSKNIVVEKYFEGDEVTANYVMSNGEIKLTCIHDRYFSTEQEDFLKVPDVYIYPSRYTKMYLENVNDRVLKMLKKSGYENGSLFMQACVEDDEVYFYETGTRLNGCKIFHIVESETGFSALRGLINHSLTGKMGYDEEFSRIDPELKHWYSTLSILSHPGKIGEIRGLDEIREIPEVITISQWYKEGDEIKPEFRGTLLQTLVRISLRADTKEELFNTIEKVYGLIECYNEDGDYMLLKKHDVDDLRKKVDYEL